MERVADVMKEPLEGENDSAQWGSLAHLSAVRIVVLAIWLITVAITPYPDYRDWPKNAIYGFGPGRLLLSSATARDLLFSWPMLVALKWLTLLGCIAEILSPRRSYGTAPALFVAVFLLDTVTKAIGGFANHAQVAPLLVLAVVTCVSKAPHLSLFELLRADRRLERLPTASAHDRTMRPDAIVWLTGVVLIIPYAYIGVNRLIRGGSSIFDGDVLLYYLAASSQGFDVYPSWLDVVQMRGLLNAGFVATTALEVTSPLLLVSRRFRVVWLGGMTAFHLLTIGLMNIWFWENLLLAVSIWGWGVAPFWRGYRASGRHGHGRTSSGAALSCPR